MTATTSRVQDYATRFAAADEAVIALAEGCGDARWRQPCVTVEQPVACWRTTAPR